MEKGIRLIAADPAGNTTGIVLTPVERAQRPALAARLMARLGLDQVGFADEDSLTAGMPRIEMMGGEFCGNAARAFALLAAMRRGMARGRLNISISGSDAPVPVDVDVGMGKAYAQMPLPLGCMQCAGVPVVRMAGISHAIMQNVSADDETARRMLAAMPADDARGVIFLCGRRLTPYVHVTATDTGVWEGSCGSGSVAAAWLLAGGLPDGLCWFEFAEPGGMLRVEAEKKNGRVVRMRMGGSVRIGEAFTPEI